MKRCPACEKHFESSLDKCPACNHEPVNVDGFRSFAPDFCYEGGGFKSHYFTKLSLLEAENFWFRARNNLIIWAIRKYRPQFHSLLEIGCGTGFVLSGISKSCPGAELYGSEIFTAGLGFAAKRLPDVDFFQMDARALPYFEEFDVIGAFDVLEHIREDELVLNNINQALKKKGICVITVPQHKWLWSATDDYACHIRRYSKKDLHDKIESAGFKVLRSTSFVTTLLPAMMVSRLFQSENDESFNALAELSVNPVLNSIFLSLLNLELSVIKAGLDFQLGGSRLIVAEKK